ncbi:MAG TPA: secretin N-terminal domain-containing protein, partial [Gemmataceae bacterium]|nr:secretin N-terminal domain-containing protein [Gemmataceae bacterium]
MTVCGVPARPGRRRFVLAVLFLSACALAARAADPPKPDKGDKPRPAGEAKGGEPRFAFSFVNAPWTQVIEWFADNTGLAFVGNYKPAGTFTFVPPTVDGRAKSYTIAEIVDVLNEALQVNSSNKRYMLVRRSQSFTLVLADDKIPRDLIPTIDVADLPRRGRSEVVRLNVALEGADAEETAPKIKKMLTQMGDVVALDAGNRLVLIDTVGSLVEVMKTIRIIGAGGGRESAERYAHQCRFIKAHEAERVLRELYGLPPVLPPEMAVWSIRLNMERQMQQQQQHAQGNQPRPPAAKLRPVSVVAAEEANMVIVTGPADKVAEARQILTELEDKAKAGGAKEQPVGPPIVKRYAVPGGDAPALAQMLQEKYRTSQSVRVINLGANELMVSAPAAEQFDIATLISEGVGTQKVKVVPLKNGDGWLMEDTLRGMFGDRAKSPKAPYIEARTKTAI